MKPLGGKLRDEESDGTAAESLETLVWMILSDDRKFKSK